MAKGIFLYAIRSADSDGTVKLTGYFSESESEEVPDIPVYFITDELMLKHGISFSVEEGKKRVRIIKDYIISKFNGFKIVSLPFTVDRKDIYGSHGENDDGEEITGLDGDIPDSDNVGKSSDDLSSSGKRGDDKSGTGKKTKRKGKKSGSRKKDTEADSERKVTPREILPDDPGLYPVVILVIFLLEISEQEVVYRIDREGLYGRVSEALKKWAESGDALPILKDILKRRSEFYIAVRSEDWYRNILADKANGYLDAGEFGKAQEFLEMAKELPSKIAGAALKGDEAYTAGSYKQAVRYYEDAAEMCRRIGLKAAAEYFDAMVDKSSEYPEFIKRYEKIRNKLHTLPKKLGKRPSDIYTEGRRLVSEAMELAEATEQYGLLEKLGELDNVLGKAEALSFMLDDYDRKISEILTDIV